MPFEMVLGENNTAFATDSLNVVAFDTTSGQTKWTYSVPDPNNDTVDIVASTAESGLVTKLTDFSIFPNPPETIVRLDSSGTPTTDTWTSSAAANFGASELRNLKFFGSDVFFATKPTSTPLALFGSGSPIDWPMMRAVNTLQFRTTMRLGRITFR